MTNTKLYLLPLSEVKKLPPQWCHEHFPARYARSAAFHFEEDRLRCIGAGALVYGVLGIEEDCIITGEWGKPGISSSRWHISLSHSGNYILLGVSGCEIGVDIEKTNSRVLGIADKVFTPEEKTWMAQASLERFFILWTLKESVMKLYGEGLRLPPESFSVLQLAAQGCMSYGEDTLYAESFAMENHICSLCQICPVGTAERLTVTAEDLLNGDYRLPML